MGTDGILFGGLLLLLLGLLVFRAGLYVPAPGVDQKAMAAAQRVVE
jgi:hypothetical protein